MLPGVASLVNRAGLWRFAGHEWRPTQRVRPLAYRRRPQAHRPLSFPPGGKAHLSLSAAVWIQGGVRVFYPARKPGASVRREYALSDPNCGSENGELPRLDEVSLLHFCCRKPGDVGPVRILQKWSSDWNPDRRTAPR